MSCPVCGEAFATERRPRVLPCGHTFCTPCLKNLHQQNIGIIQCPQCRGEAHFETIDKIPINHWAESHIASLLQRETKEMPSHSLSDEQKGSQWDLCPVHGRPMSCWCSTCHISICSDCKNLHVAQQDRVFDYQQAKDLLQSEYKNRSQPFLEWLSKVETVTKQTLEATEAVVPVLMQTLSIIQDYRSQMKEQDQNMNDASSPEKMEDLLEKSSKWCKRRKPTARQQVDKILAAFNKIQSSMSALKKLQTELEIKFVEAGEAAATLSLSLGETVSIASTATSELKASPASVEETATLPGSIDRKMSEEEYFTVAVTGALPRPLRGFDNDVVCIEYSGTFYDTLSYTTHLKLRSESGRARCAVWYLTKYTNMTHFSILIRDKYVEVCSYNPVNGQNSPTEKGKGKDCYNIEVDIVEYKDRYRVEWGELSLECKKNDCSFEGGKIEVRGFNDEELCALYVTEVRAVLE